jgi:hypothetical protein
VLSQLPGRIDNNFFVPLTPQQRAHHDENGDTVRRIVQRWRRTGFLSDADQRMLTCALQNMRMACNSTYLLDHETDHGIKVGELTPVVDAGLALVQGPMRDGAGQPRALDALDAAVERDPATGRDFLKIPLPQPQHWIRTTDRWRPPRRVMRCPRAAC